MKKIFLMLLILGVCNISFAQVHDPCDSEDPDAEPCDPTIPIDGGLSILLGSGVALGIGGLYKSKKKREEA